jgi:hypothetical protein
MDQGRAYSVSVPASVVTYTNAVADKLKILKALAAPAVPGLLR